jgi:hypothetical protein
MPLWISEEIETEAAENQYNDCKDSRKNRKVNKK